LGAPLPLRVDELGAFSELSVVFIARHLGNERFRLPAEPTCAAVPGYDLGSLLAALLRFSGRVGRDRRCRLLQLSVRICHQAASVSDSVAAFLPGATTGARFHNGSFPLPAGLAGAVLSCRMRSL